MKTLTVGRIVDASPAAVWAVLADYPNIMTWNDGVTNSRAIGDQTEGVGAQRVCELAPGGAMRETVTEWVAEKRLAVAIDEITKMPVKEARMTFALGDGDASTPLTMTYDYAPKGGPLSFLIAALMGPQMKKGFNGFIDGLEAAAQNRAV
ncbi:MAG: SRPBCC family protein [Actinomycetota bacterium]